jgi:hypothetical protein
VELGMADRVGTLDETIAQLANPQHDLSASAQAEQANPTAPATAGPGALTAMDEEKEREVESLRKEIQKYL